MVKVIIQSYNDVIPRAVSILYSCLMEAKNDSTLYVKAKWEKESSEEILDNMWYDMWKIHQTNYWVTRMERIYLEKQNLFLYNAQDTSKQVNTPQPCWRLQLYVS